MITSTPAESFLFHFLCLSGQNFVIFAKNFQASILWLCSFFGMLVYVCCYYYSSWCTYCCFHLSRPYLERITKTAARLSDFMEGRKQCCMPWKILWCTALSSKYLSSCLDKSHRSIFISILRVYFSGKRTWPTYIFTDNPEHKHKVFKVLFGDRFLTLVNCLQFLIYASLVLSLLA